MALAALLLEVAHIDGEYSPAEAEMLIDLLGPAISRGLVQSNDLMVRARALLRRVESIDVVVNALRERLEPKDRVNVLRLMFEVARADGRVDRYEANLVNRMATLLEVSARFGPSRS